MPKYKNILIVDDDPDWQQILTEPVDTRIFTITLASDYSAALDKLLEADSWFATEDMVACVVDLRLDTTTIKDNWDGLGLLAVCKIRQIPTIVVSGHLNPKLEEYLLKECGAIGCIDKGKFDQDRYSDFLLSISSNSQARNNPRATQFQENLVADNTDYLAKLQQIRLAINDNYMEAHQIINERQKQRASVRGQMSEDDEMVWEHEINELDRKYRTVINKLREISDLSELDKLHPEIMKECITWTITFTE